MTLIVKVILEQTGLNCNALKICELPQEARPLSLK